MLPRRRTLMNSQQNMRPWKRCISMYGIETVNKRTTRYSSSTTIGAFANEYHDLKASSGNANDAPSRLQESLHGQSS